MTVPENIAVVAITGHRLKDFTQPTAAWTQAELHRVLTRLRDENGACILNTGMAAGSDLWAAHAADALGYDLHAFLPFDAEAQTLRWNQATKDLHALLLAKAKDTHVVGTVEHMMEAYHARNEMLVDRADVLVAVWSGRDYGGTAHAIRHALVTGVPIIVISIRNHRTYVGDPQVLATQLNCTLPVNQ